MYLLEAKKKAEKEFKAEQKRLEKQKRDDLRRERYAKKVEVKEAAKAAKQETKKRPKEKKPGATPRPSGADDAARALKAQEQLAKDKEAREVQEAIRRSKEDARQAELAKTRQALSSEESDYSDRITEQVPAVTSRDRVFQQVENPNNNSEWTDVSINCHYVGTFEVGEEAKVDKAEVKRGINAMKDYIHGQRGATLIICLEGIKVIDTTSNKVAMAHALNRISMAAADSELPLFGVVAKNPGVNAKYCHVFNMRSRKHAESVQGVVMKAFRLAYTNRRLSVQPVKGKPGAKPAAAVAAAAKKSAPPPRASAGHAKPAGAAVAAAPRQERVANRQWAKHNPLSAQGRPVPVASRPPPSRVQSNPAPARAAAAKPRRVESAPVVAQTPAAPTPSAPTPSAPTPSAPAIGSDYAEAPGPLPKEDHGDLAAHAWFQAGIPREIAMELLEKEDEGSFVVRESSSQPGNFALTMKGGGLMHHFIVRKVPTGYVLGSEDQGQMPFSDLGTLIIAYAKNKGCLPCCLNLDSFNTVFDEEDDDDHEQGGDGGSSFIDPDYQDMVSLMKEL
eukprot:m.177655 g.177655  ORF g.177655 m.177655 type:complete len:562 (+) comp24497_c0_seq2:2263-3948(+)